MRSLSPQELAHTIKADLPELAVDLLRAAGYTRKAAKLALEQPCTAGALGVSGEAPFAKDINA